MEALETGLFAALIVATVLNDYPLEVEGADLALLDPLYHLLI
jgi:hypothetical protein